MIDNFDRIIKKLREAKNSGVGQKVLKKIGADFIEAVKTRTPVDTGLLRRSWKVEENKKKGDMYMLRIANRALNKKKEHYYGRWVEFGHWTKKIKGTNKRNWVPGYFMKTLTEEEFKTRDYSWYFTKLLREYLFDGE